MDADFSQLTEREKQICQMVKEGFETAEIAESLKLSQQTLRHVFSEIYEKVGVSNKRELVEALDAKPG